MPIWSRSRPEIVYRTDDRRVMVVRYDVVNENLVPARPREWPVAQLADSGILPSFDLAPDGDHLIALVPVVRDAQAVNDDFEVAVNLFGNSPKPD